MAIKITPKFSANDIAKWSAEVRARVINTMLSRLQFVGEDFVVNARSINTYMDQTNNLRSSIGYVVSYNGNILSQNFEVSGKGTGSGEKGVQEAQKLAKDIADNYPTGFVLVCVAGMDYAAAVESRGYDVITNSSITAVSDLRQAMRDLKAKINRTP
jgi:hypothetical protein